MGFKTTLARIPVIKRFIKPAQLPQTDKTKIRKPVSKLTKTSLPIKEPVKLDASNFKALLNHAQKHGMAKIDFVFHREKKDGENHTVLHPGLKLPFAAYIEQVYKYKPWVNDLSFGKITIQHSEKGFEVDIPFIKGTMNTLAGRLDTDKRQLLHIMKQIAQASKTKIIFPK